MFKIIFKIIAIIVIYASIVTLFKSMTSQKSSITKGPQHMLFQAAPNPQSNLLLNSNQMGKEPLFSIKKFIAQHFREIQPITNTIIETLEKIFPQAWLSGILGFIYFIFTFTFGGGFSYFNRNIKELSNHQAKIERGIDLKQKFEQKSSTKNLKNVLPSFQQLNFKQYSSLIDFLSKDVKQVKIIQSSKRQDISDIISTYLVRNKVYKFNSSYLNLQIIPFNHESNTKNLHVHILDDIVYGLLFEKDRGVSLALLKAVIKLGKDTLQKLCNLVVVQWINLTRLTYLFGISLGYMVNPQIAILFTLFKIIHYTIAYFYIQQTTKKPLKLVQQQYLIIDKFQLIKQELMNKNQIFLEENLLVFSQIIQNLINLAKEKHYQIILIVQEPLFFELIIKNVCSLTKLKLFTFYRIEQIDFQDAEYLSKYLDADYDIIDKALEWCNDFHQIKAVVSESKSQLQILDDAIQVNIRKIDQIVMEYPKLKEQVTLLLKFIIYQAISQFKNTKNKKRISQQLQIYFRKHIANSSLLPSKQTIEKHLNELKLIIENYPPKRQRFYSLRQRYFLMRQLNKSDGIEWQRIYQQVFNLLNKKQLLYQHQFYSKTVCISIYLWCNRLL